MKFTSQFKSDSVNLTSAASKIMRALAVGIVSADNENYAIPKICLTVGEAKSLVKVLDTIEAD